MVSTESDCSCDDLCIRIPERSRANRRRIRSAIWIFDPQRCYIGNFCELIAVWGVCEEMALLVCVLLLAGELSATVDRKSDMKYSKSQACLDLSVNRLKRKLKPKLSEVFLSTLGLKISRQLVAFGVDLAEQTIPSCLNLIAT